VLEIILIALTQSFYKSSKDQHIANDLIKRLESSSNSVGKQLNGKTKIKKFDNKK
jgi:hypothetical protein